MFCRSCGTMIPDDSNFCPKCGIKVVVPKQDSPRPVVQRTSYARSRTNAQAVNRAEQSHKVDGQLFREIAMLVGGLVVVWIGYATWIGSTLSQYFSTKSSTYQAEFGQSAPDAIQWVMGIGGFLINVAGAICLYIAVCPIAQRFGAWRKQNKIIGAILAVVICLIVFVCFSLKTSVTGSFGVWDYMIMAAIFGGMWRGGKQSDEPREEGSVNVTHCKDDRRRRVFLVAGTVFSIMVVGGLVWGSFTYRKNKNSNEAKQYDEHTKRMIGQLKTKKESKGNVKHNAHEDAAQYSINRTCAREEDLNELSDDTRIAEIKRSVTVDKFLAAYRDGRYEEAAKLVKIAEHDNVNVQFAFATMLANGRGVAKNEREATKWFRRAAVQGCIEAQERLAVLFLNGRNTPEDKINAVNWYRKAAEQGYSFAQYHLGQMFFNGWGVNKNEEEGIKWQRKAAEQGYPRAQMALGDCYILGVHVDKDVTKGIGWIRKAANQGFTEAQWYLATLYRFGGLFEENVVNIDEEESIKWYRKAAKGGNKKAQEILSKNGLTW